MQNRSPPDAGWTYELHELERPQVLKEPAYVLVVPVEPLLLVRHYGDKV